MASTEDTSVTSADDLSVSITSSADASGDTSDGAVADADDALADTGSDNDFSSFFVPLSLFLEHTFLDFFSAFLRVLRFLPCTNTSTKRARVLFP